MYLFSFPIFKSYVCHYSLNPNYLTKTSVTIGSSSIHDVKSLASLTVALTVFSSASNTANLLLPSWSLSPSWNYFHFYLCITTVTYSCPSYDENVSKFITRCSFMLIFSAFCLILLTLSLNDLILFFMALTVIDILGFSPYLKSRYCHLGVH